MNRGDFDGALVDCTRALEVDPKYNFAYAGRGVVKMCSGDLEGALADLNHALKTDPKFDRVYASRGRVYLAQRNWNAALADFRHGGDLGQPDQDYGAIDIWLIHMQLGESDTASKDLAAYYAKRKGGKPDDWESTVADFLLGKVKEADFLAVAAAADVKGAGDLIENGHRCEAWYYAGMKHLFAGDKSAAVDDLTKCIATDKKVFFEYQFAQSELKAMGK